MDASAFEAEAVVDEDICGADTIAGSLEQLASTAEAGPREACADQARDLQQHIEALQKEKEALAAARLVVTTVAGQRFMLEAHCSDTWATVKQFVVEAGGPIKEMQLLLWNGELLQDDATIAEVGIPPGSDVEVCLVLTSRNCFRWSECAGGFLQEDGACFVRAPIAQVSHGARTAVPLPQWAAWKVSLTGQGSHATVGVATAAAALERKGYDFVFGVDEASWALCFGRERWMAAHSGSRLNYGEMATPDGTEAIVRMQRRGTELIVLLPGEATEQVLFTSLPEAGSLYCVASTNWGHARLVISEDEDWRDESDASR